MPSKVGGALTTPPSGPEPPAPSPPLPLAATGTHFSPLSVVPAPHVRSLPQPLRIPSANGASTALICQIVVRMLVPFRALLAQSSLQDPIPDRAVLRTRQRQRARSNAVTGLLHARVFVG